MTHLHGWGAADEGQAVVGSGEQVLLEDGLVAAPLAAHPALWGGAQHVVHLQPLILLRPPVQVFPAHTEGRVSLGPGAPGREQDWGVQDGPSDLCNLSVNDCCSTRSQTWVRLKVRGVRVDAGAAARQFQQHRVRVPEHAQHRPACRCGRSGPSTHLSRMSASVWLANTRRTRVVSSLFIKIACAAGPS